VVHGEDRRPLALPPQLGVEPAELLGVEGAGVLAGHARIEDDQPKLADLDGVVDGLVPVTRQIEGLPDAGPVVVVAREDVDGTSKLSSSRRARR
jgi:hypothetical protein